MRVGLLGCGVMGSAFARAIGDRVDWVLKERRSDSSAELTKTCDIIVVAVKPKDLQQACAELQDTPADTLIISMLAGVRLSVWKEALPGKSICRILPNLPIEIGEGVVGIADDPDLSPKHREDLCTLLENMGLVQFLKEDKLEALSALAGSGPAFVYMLLEAWTEAGIAMGLKSEEALALATQTFKGAATQCAQSKQHPASLKWAVAAPGGTSIVGLNEMEAQGVRTGIVQGLLATRKQADA